MTQDVLRPISLQGPHCVSSTRVRYIMERPASLHIRIQQEERADGISTSLRGYVEAHPQSSACRKPSPEPPVTLRRGYLSDEGRRCMGRVRGGGTEGVRREWGGGRLVDYMEKQNKNRVSDLTSHTAKLYVCI